MQIFFAHYFALLCVLQDWMQIEKPPERCHILYDTRIKAFSSLLSCAGVMFRMWVAWLRMNVKFLCWILYCHLAFMRYNGQNRLLKSDSLTHKPPHSVQFVPTHAVWFVSKQSTNGCSGTFLGGISLWKVRQDTGILNITFTSLSCCLTWLRDINKPETTDSPSGEEWKAVSLNSARTWRKGDFACVSGFLCGGGGGVGSTQLYC